MSDATSTLRGALARAIRRELARMGILIAAEYRVVTQSGPYVELQIVTKSAGLPDTSRVLSRPSAGYAPTYQLGSLVLVAFVAGDPSRPFIAFGPEVGSSTPPGVTVDATGTLTLGPSASAVVQGAPTVPAPLVREGDIYALAGSVIGNVTLTFVSTTQPSGQTKAKG